MNEYLQLAWAVFLTIISGIVYSVLFYAQAWKQGEEFNGQKFLRTIIWGGLIGAFAYYLQLDLPQAEQYMTTFGGGFLVIVVDQVAIIIWGKYGDRILALFGKKPPETPVEPTPPTPAPAAEAPPSPPPQRGCPMNPPMAGR